MNGHRALLVGFLGATICSLAWPVPALAVATRGGAARNERKLPFTGLRPDRLAAFPRGGATALVGTFDGLPAGTSDGLPAGPSPQEGPVEAVPGRGHVFVALRSGGVLVAERRAPTSGPGIESFLPAPGGEVSAITFADGFLYVVATEGDSILTVIDAREPARLAVVASLRMDRPVSGLAAWGGHVFLSYPSGMGVVDASDPSRPVEVARLATAARADWFAVHDGRAFLVATQDDPASANPPDTPLLTVIDVRAPARPRTVGCSRARCLEALSGRTVRGVVVDRHGVYLGLAPSDADRVTSTGPVGIDVLRIRR